MEIRKIPVSEIQVNINNPRKELKPEDAEFTKLKNSIERWDLVEPLVINKRTGTLISGHYRLSVCKSLGITTVEAVMVDLSPEREKLLNISLNKTGSDWDYLKLGELFSEFSLDELNITGFDDKEIMQILEINDAPDDMPEEKLKEKKEHRKNQEDGKDDYVVYLIFTSKEMAEEWLENEGIDKKFGDSESVKVKMGGEDNGY